MKSTDVSTIIANSSDIIIIVIVVNDTSTLIIDISYRAGDSSYCGN